MLWMASSVVILMKMMISGVMTTIVARRNEASSATTRGSIHGDGGDNHSHNAAAADADDDTDQDSVRVGTLSHPTRVVPVVVVEVVVDDDGRCRQDPLWYDGIVVVVVAMDASKLVCCGWVLRVSPAATPSNQCFRSYRDPYTTTTTTTTTFCDNVGRSYISTDVVVPTRCWVVRMETGGHTRAKPTCRTYVGWYMVHTARARRHIDST